MSYSYNFTTPSEVIQRYANIKAMREQRKDQQLKNAEAAIDLGLRELAFTDESNWPEFVSRQQKRGVFDDKYAQSLIQQGYSNVLVEQLREQGMAYKDRIELQMKQEYNNARISALDARTQKTLASGGGTRGRPSTGGGGGMRSPAAGGGFFGDFTPAGSAGGMPQSSAPISTGVFGSGTPASRAPT